MNDATSPELSSRVSSLEAQLAELQSRVDSLTASHTGTSPGFGDGALELSRRPVVTSGGREPTSEWVDDPADPYFALTALKRRLPEDGGVVFAGSVQLSERAAADWQYGLPTQTLVEEPWESRAETIGALGHPVRLQLLQEVVLGAASVAQLTQIDGLGTSGQVYHHLRQLAAAGWVQPTTRGRYEVPAVRLIPLLALILAARR